MRTSLYLKYNLITLAKVLLVLLCSISFSYSHANSDVGKATKHGEMKHGDMKHGEMKHGAHGHNPVDVGDWPATPSLTLTVHKDLKSGWNLHIEPKHFNFAPRHVNTENQPGEGHAHIYINGEKLTRLYSQWFYLNNLTPGAHTVTVSLNANDHGPLVLNDKAITATIKLHQE